MNTYFITFSTYGTRLHGDPRGTVDRDHNVPGDPLLEPSANWVAYREHQLADAPYLLDAPSRAIVLLAICQHATFRGWHLYAAHVRTNHVHIVVQADTTPERVMGEFKAYASRALNAANPDETGEHRRWTRHGSTLWLKSDDAIVEKVRYTAFEQGAIMSLYVVPLV